MITLNENEILVLQKFDSHSMPNYESHLPIEVGSIFTAPDWRPEYYHSGLHGLPWGEGSVDYLLNYEDSTYVLTAVDTSCDYISSIGNCNICKFKSGRIEFVGNFAETLDLLRKYAPENKRVICSNQTAGQKAVQTAGDKSTQTAKRYATQIAGYESIQKAEYSSTQTAGRLSYQEAQNFSHQTSGEKSIQTAGSQSTQLSGDHSYQEAGNQSIQIAGGWSIQTAGGWSIQMAEDGSTQIVCSPSYQRAGIGSIQILHWFGEHKSETLRRIITEVEADKWYYTKDGEWILQDPPEHDLNTIKEMCENF